MIAACLVLATLFYWLLLLVPPIMRNPPKASFACDGQGGFILQDRCGADRTCYNWGTGKGSVMVKNCEFSCNATSEYAREVTTEPPKKVSSDFNEDTDYYDSGAIVEAEIGYLTTPHLLGITVYNTSHILTCVTRMIGLKPNENVNDTEGTCRYPFIDEFQCRISEDIHNNLTDNGAIDCQPVILCELHNPYTNTDSLLKKSQCGYDHFWLYLFLRSVADIFPAAAAVLIGTAVVIATRETSTGRGDVGKQFAAGALGFGIFAPIIGSAANGRFFDAMICFTVLMAIAVIILLFDNKMPLSPPEWWWHTRCGLLALPMSSVRKYGLETAALAVILFLLGIFWNAIDSYLPWHVVRITDGEPLLIGLTLTIGALPAVIFLVFAERVVDYCGHNNILIFCFVNYICHHLALMFIDNAAYLLFCEWMEVFTLHIMYITAVLYLRHLVPRKLTACGQALPIVAHFCLGRCIGALLGGMAYADYNAEYNFQRVHGGFTIAAAVAATLYFLAYHFYLKPKCAPPMHLPPDPAPAVVQSMNGNGSYTPLRVYHNSKSKKGHFRY
ncbi:hypothetical protein JTB14_013450 [Gonioctena quinquepunctata]|nr:hypothetical protein JTB14_013450 [Gonioctena quinquepunctata]